MKRAIGIYSGTFDPIHQGHIAFARESMRLCALDQVVFLPESLPREKPVVTPIQQRIQVISKILDTEKDMSVVRLSSKQFSTDTTLPELYKLFDNAAFTLLIGSDVVRTLPYRWKDLDVLLSSVKFAIGMRSGDSVEEIVEILDQLKKTYSLKIHYTLVDTPHAHLASTHIRNTASKD
jgi:nicotinate-nucleotide adenylyltransferase